MNNMKQTEVLLVGVFHFAGSAGDAIELLVEDILEDYRQQEAVQLVELLARFGPTRVALEIEPHLDEVINNSYRNYVAGRKQLGPTEQQQLGFRLAARMGLNHVDLIDHMFETPFGPLLETMKRDDPKAHTELWTQLQRVERDTNRILKQESLGAALANLNQPGKLSANHEMYLSLARFGAGNNYEGARLLGSWYERNARIFANICRLVKPGEKIAVLIGAGHVPILSQLFSAHQDVQLRMFHELARSPDAKSP